MLKTMSAAALSFLLAVGGGVAFAASGGQAPSPAATSSASSGQKADHAAPGAMGFEEEEVQTAPWTVERIDKKNHDLVLRAADGTQNTVNIPPGTPGFDSLKKGDKIELDYFEAAVIGVPGNSAKPSSQTGAGSGHANADNSNRRVRSIRKVQNNSTDQSGHTAPTHTSNESR
jgi:hypothetical protein